MANKTIHELTKVVPVAADQLALYDVSGNTTGRIEVGDLKEIFIGTDKIVQNIPYSEASEEYRTQVPSLQAVINTTTNLSQDLNTLEGDVDTLQTNLSNLSSSVSQAWGDINNLNSRINSSKDWLKTKNLLNIQSLSPVTTEDWYVNFNTFDGSIDFSYIKTIEVDPAFCSFDIVINKDLSDGTFCAKLSYDEDGIVVIYSVFNNGEAQVETALVSLNSRTKEMRVPGPSEYDFLRVKIYINNPQQNIIYNGTLKLMYVNSGATDYTYQPYTESNAKLTNDKVSKTGDKMTGSLSFLTDISATEVPSANVFKPAIAVRSDDGSLIGLIQGAKTSNDEIGINLGAARLVNGNMKYAATRILVDNTGAPVVKFGGDPMRNAWVNGLLGSEVVFNEPIILKKSGGEATLLQLHNTGQATHAQIDNPTSLVQIGGLSMRDSQNVQCGYIQTSVNTSGDVYTVLSAGRQTSATDTTLLRNGLYLKVKKDGTREIEVTHVAAWRKALVSDLGSNNYVASSGTISIAPPSGSSNVYLPKSSGGADLSITLTPGKYLIGGRVSFLGFKANETCRVFAVIYDATKNADLDHYARYNEMITTTNTNAQQAGSFYTWVDITANTTFKLRVWHNSANALTVTGGLQWIKVGYSNL